MEDSQKLSTIKIWLGTGSINLFGRQFCGKDTQCDLLARDLGGIVIGGGEILRSGNTPREVMEQVNAGNLAPTEAYRSIVTPYLAKQEFTDIPLLLSTVGRMKGEEEVVIRAARESGHEIKAVIFLDISEQITWERFRTSTQDGTREKRIDDDEEGIKKRLQLFNESTIPVINVYRELGLVIDIDASKPVMAVYADIIDELYKKAQQA